MFSRCLLLVLVCLQVFTTAGQKADGPAQCCFSYQTRPIPLRAITGYEVTKLPCTRPAVIFTLNDSRRVCADPTVPWVQGIMEKLSSI